MEQASACPSHAAPIAATDDVPLDQVKEGMEECEEGVERVPACHQASVACSVRPRRYELGELIDYMFRVMRREVGYIRYDMRFDPFFLLRVQFLETFGFKYPHLSWERLEREHTSDVVYYEHPTLDDLKVSLTCVEDRFPFELKYYREAAYYDPDIAQFEKVRPPPVILD
ncbi:hypothetical protein HPB52_012500 [Rhipicephalus sanguineus]|uniref:Uncharacterized protein n=1 Tax=Rhipicephalus sanguineus TaxID=34632 RepID=A0A9D4Q959_RHISA|nr:hypothetical protein HPB52_012500 [Rhipicephalus sanguineus]